MMRAAPLEFATIEELARLLARKKLSPVDLARLHLDRIELLNPRLNAFLTVTAKDALAAARRAERELSRGRSRGPLHGIPVSVKDNIWMRGVRTTAGSAILRDFVPEQDAAVVARLRRAGAVILGKTNLHEFAYGITSENPRFGPVHNPWDLTRISGGSTGGGAAAVAAGLCVAAIGTDTGGSIRIPASLCGIVGFKAGFGRLSVEGIVPLAASFDHAGLLARGVADVCLLFAALTGAKSPAERSLRGKRGGPKFLLGIPRQHFWERLDPEIERLARSALQSFAAQGAALEEVSLPSTAQAVEAANTIALVEARDYHQSAGYFPARAAEYDPAVSARLEAGGNVPATGYLAAWRTVRRSRAEFAEVLARVEAIVFPASPVAATPIGAETVRIGDTAETIRSALVRNNRPANFTGLPAISLPCGFTRAGLPAGLQLIGRPSDETRLLAIARLYEQVNPWRNAHPLL